MLPTNYLLWSVIPIDKYSVQYTASSNGLAIKFNSQCRTENANYDYVEIYYIMLSGRLDSVSPTHVLIPEISVKTSSFKVFVIS